MPGHTTPASPNSLTAPIAQSPFSPGWVMRYGIAPYSSELWSIEPRSSGGWLSCGSVGNVHCQMKTATLMAMNATVITGNREVGRSSFSGITGGGD